MSAFFWMARLALSLTVRWSHDKVLAAD
jgi:hypothetical protein